MGGFHPAHKFAGVPAHHPLDHHVHPTQADGGSESEIHSAIVQTPVNQRRRPKTIGKQKPPSPPRDAHKTADHTPGPEAILDQDMRARDDGYCYNAITLKPTNLSLPATKLSAQINLHQG